MQASSNLAIRFRRASMWRAVRVMSSAYPRSARTTPPSAGQWVKLIAMLKALYDQATTRRKRRPARVPSSPRRKSDRDACSLQHCLTFFHANNTFWADPCYGGLSCPRKGPSPGEGRVPGLNTVRIFIVGVTTAPKRTPYSQDLSSFPDHSPSRS